MIRKLYYSIMVLVLVGITNVGAQDFRKIANKQYDLNAYELAAYNYDLALKEQPDNAELKAKVAMCYFKMNKNLEAIKLFSEAEKVIKLTQEELAAYGNAARKIADYTKARTIFGQLAEINPSMGNHFILSCDYAEKLLKDPQPYQFHPFGGNNNASDFGAVAYKDDWVFVSLRSDLVDNNQDKVPAARLYKTDKISSNYENIYPLTSPLKNEYQMGPISYTKNYTRCAIMKNTMQEGSMPVYAADEGGMIYLAKVDNNGSYYDLKPFAHNKLGSSTAFPSFTQGGDALYFSSNREGGYGGYDIYVSYWQDGEWTVPQNLGPTINSVGNEITPYIDDHTLYFASDYLHGIGGYDIFRSEVYNGNWTYPANVGNGVNSPGDDLFPYLSKETGKLYFSSNRLGSVGGFDIFVGYKHVDYLPINKQENILAMEDDYDMPVVQQVSAPAQPKNNIPEGRDIAVFTKEVDVASMDSKVENVNKEIKESKEEAIPKAYVLPEEKSEKTYVPTDWKGAQKVSLLEEEETGRPVYFIQIAALSKLPSGKGVYKDLSKYGNVYAQKDANLTKVRLGYFQNENEARNILQSVKAMGYTDAFITEQSLNTSNLELITSNFDNNNTSGSYMAPSKFKGKSYYKVRLASYSDPTWFDISKAKDLGKIEQWTKGGWTIFISSGYPDRAAAERAKIRAINKGFVDAEIVFDNNGILEKVKSN